MKLMTILAKFASQSCKPKFHLSLEFARPHHAFVRVFTFQPFWPNQTETCQSFKISTAVDFMAPRLSLFHFMSSSMDFGTKKTKKSDDLFGQIRHKSPEICFLI